MAALDWVTPFASAAAVQVATSCTHSASLAWQRVQRAGVTPVRAWTIPLTTAQQVPVAVQPASDPGRQSQGNRETPHSSQHVSSTTGMTESALLVVNARVDFLPQLGWVTGDFLPKVLVVNDPGRLPVLFAGCCDCRCISHQFWDSSWLLLC